MESGIARYDEASGEAVILASSRRRPAQNQFDDREIYSVQGVFAGPGGKPCVAIGFGETFCMDEKPGPWPRLIPSGLLDFFAKTGSRTLLYGRRLQPGDPGEMAFLVDPAKPNPELWLGSPSTFLGTRMVGSPSPLPPQPPWSQAPIWPWPAGAENTLGYGVHGDDLFGFVRQKATDQYQLLWYRRGGPAPLPIPLQFKMDDEAALALKKRAEADDDRTRRFRALQNTNLQMYATDSGLCFFAPSKGFWFLPYGDLGRYLGAQAVAGARP